MFTILDIINPQSPILHKLNTINSIVFIIEPTSVPYIASFAFPIACIQLVSGA